MISAETKGQAVSVQLSNDDEQNVYEMAFLLAALRDGMEKRHGKKYAKEVMHNVTHKYKVIWKMFAIADRYDIDMDELVKQAKESDNPDKS